MKPVPGLFFFLFTLKFLSEDILERFENEQT
jgi:hypothetical protein